MVIKRADNFFAVRIVHHNIFFISLAQQEKIRLRAKSVKKNYVPEPYLFMDRYSLSILSIAFFIFSTNILSCFISLPSIFSTTRILKQLTKTIGSVVSFTISFSSTGNSSIKTCREIPLSPRFSIGGVIIFPEDKEKIFA